MNHRYSYCKKEAEERDGMEHEETLQETLSNEHVDSQASPSQIDSDERESIVREDDSEKEEEDEKDTDDGQDEKESVSMLDLEEPELGVEPVEPGPLEGTLKDDECVDKIKNSEPEVAENHVSENEAAHP